MVKHTGGQVPWTPGRDLWLEQELAKVDDDCPPEEMNAEDPLFILYTSGSTGQPKGVLHTSGGYLVYAAMTHQYVFDYHDGDIYWCTADVGWVTGHSYIVYGPLANGATTLIFEGVPNYPDASRFWQVVDKHKVNIFYTAPTAIRALMGLGDDYVKSSKRKSLKLLGTVGEPINPEAWEWYYHVVGEQRCPIVDTWWQTETGGILITPLPGATKLKPGSATLPFFGVQPAIVDNEGNLLNGEATGNLVILEAWPGMMRTVYGDHKRFVDTYFSTYKGKYFTGDGCRRDDDGYYWITGRVDDVINVAGHRMGTAEVESALVAHPKVSEAAVVGYPHDVKGQGIYCYVTLMADQEWSDALKTELRDWVRKEIGPIASPDLIQFAPGLPKTRSGKIMRRILRKIAEDDFGNLGDTSTLADPSVVDRSDRAPAEPEIGLRGTAMLKKALIGFGIVLALLIAIVVALGFLTPDRDIGQPDRVADGRQPHRHRRRPLQGHDAGIAHRRPQDHRRRPPDHDRSRSARGRRQDAGAGAEPGRGDHGRRERRGLGESGAVRRRCPQRSAIGPRCRRSACG